MLRRLGINEAELLLSPDIDSLFRTMYGGISTAIEALRYSFDKEVEAFLNVWDAAKEYDKARIPIQGWVLKAGLDVTKFLGLAILAIQAYSTAQAKILLMSNYKEVMQARINNAKQPNGHKDREAIDIILGTLPVPKGATFITNNILATAGNGGPRNALNAINNRAALAVGAGNAIEAQAEELTPPDEIDMTCLFPSLAETQKSIGNGAVELNPARVLDAVPVEEIPEETDEDAELRALEAELMGEGN